LGKVQKRGSLAAGGEGGRMQPMRRRHPVGAAG